MRLFIAIPVPDNVKDLLVSAQLKLKHAKMVLVKKEAMHVTLKFLGEVPESKMDEIKKRLSGVRFEKCGMRLDGLGVFPASGAPKVVWIGLKPKQKLVELHQHIEQALSGLFPAGEHFHAHLTLARVKLVENKKEFKELLKTISVLPLEFDVKSFELVASTLTPEGPVYKVLAFSTEQDRLLL